MQRVPKASAMTMSGSRTDLRPLISSAFRYGRFYVLEKIQKTLSNASEDQIRIRASQGADGLSTDLGVVQV